MTVKIEMEMYARNKSRNPHRKLKPRIEFICIHIHMKVCTRCINFNITVRLSRFL